MVVKDEKGRFVKGHTGYKYWQGKKLHPETVEKIRQARLGKKRPPFTEEHKRRISEAHLAKGRSVVKSCEYCSNSFRVGLSRQSARFCSIKCRSMVIMPPTPRQYGKKPWNKGLTRSTDERLKKISEGRMGKNNWQYIHGQSKSARLKWRSSEHKEWRKAVFERDGYSCVLCGSGGDLNADHIKCFAHNEDLRFDVSNGRTLCVPCHKKTPNYGTHPRENCNG